MVHRKIGLGACRVEHSWIGALKEIKDMNGSGIARNILENLRLSTR